MSVREIKTSTRNEQLSRFVGLLLVTLFVVGLLLTLMLIIASVGAGAPCGSC